MTANKIVFHYYSVNTNTFQIYRLSGLKLKKWSKTSGAQCTSPAHASHDTYTQTPYSPATHIPYPRCGPLEFIIRRTGIINHKSTTRVRSSRAAYWYMYCSFTAPRAARRPRQQKRPLSPVLHIWQRQTVAPRGGGGGGGGIFMGEWGNGLVTTQNCV